MSLSAHPPASSRTDIQIGILLSVVMVVVMSAWNAGKLLDNSSVKYVLYALPFLVLLVFGLVLRGRIELDRHGALALLCYGFIAVLAVLNGEVFSWFATRDLLIIGSYLLVFVVFFRAPRFVADGLLAFCIIGTLSVVLIRGVSADYGIFRPDGQQLLESVVSFPAGMLFLYYVKDRQWGRGLITLILFVLAFKRIAFLGVGMVLCLEMGLYICFNRSIGRVVSSLIVMALSVLALFSLQIFELMATLFDEINISANSVSLGRAEIATELWDRVDVAAFGQKLMGFGPGAADYVLFESGLENNPHNDWLKILFDYGIIGFIGMHVVLRLIHPNTALGNAVYIYSAVLMTTGNLIIYTYYFIPLYLITRIALRNPIQKTKADKTFMPGPVASLH